MLVGQLKDIENETNECQELIEQLREGGKSQIVKSRDGHDFEKTIYRLYQMGFVVDWTVEDFFRNIYEVEWNDMSLIWRTNWLCYCRVLRQQRRRDVSLEQNSRYCLRQGI